MKRNNTTTPRTFVPPIDPAARPAPTVDTVAAKWRDNLGMWIGVTTGLIALRVLGQMLLAAVGIVETSWPARDAFLMWLAGSFFAGMLAFAVLMAWRSALDERERQGQFNEMAADIADLEEILIERDERIADLERRLANTVQDLHERMILQQTLTTQRAANFTPSVASVTEPTDPTVYRNARTLVERACRNQPFSKGAICGDGNKPGLLGWTQGEWREAHQFCQDAGIFRVVGRSTELLVDDLNTALSVLDIYANPQSVAVTD